MYSYYNANPYKIRVGDCVIRAISKALNQSWEDTYIDLTIIELVKDGQIELKQNV